MHNEAAVEGVLASSAPLTVSLTVDHTSKKKPIQHLILCFASFLNFFVLDNKKSDPGRAVFARIGWPMTARPHVK